MTIGERIKNRRNMLGISADQLAEMTGKSRATIYRYENEDIKNLPSTILETLAIALNTTPADLMGWDETESNVARFKHPIITNDTVTFPVIGEIAAGYDSIAVEDWSGETVEVPSVYLKGRKYEDYIVLAVKGDSMYPHYMEGDKVLILRQSCVNSNGDVGAVIYNDEMATLKKIFTNSDHVELVPINPEYKPKRIEGEEMDHVRILGIPKMLIREFNN